MARGYTPPRAMATPSRPADALAFAFRLHAGGQLDQAKKLATDLLRR
ncbi:MAG: hypothetical protein JO021_12020 [Alphaproteobacteria bacterium]|nr:hypothetical protein [Alphaproteobacteria bacterium]